MTLLVITKRDIVRLESLLKTISMCRNKLKLFQCVNKGFESCLIRYYKYDPLGVLSDMLTHLEIISPLDFETRVEGLL